ncbi:hypothetical protein [Paucibacter sp. XJ19-41]|uniref:hypothetical protein n=1 Tax=Paucibacter sp. XJ19-41 TaxID=2927824 RepID=UPI00234A1A08|nr:hypothetical protein [Paucibacter sp. XJ19-41]MDC6171318.1 hypothetical protein [Paucibacter sp. XJ19-41]
MLIFFCASLGCFSSSAQQFVPGYAAMVSYYAGVCPALAKDATDDLRVSAVFRRSPADIARVCHCAQKAFLADRRLRTFVDVPPNLHAARLSKDSTRQYVSLSYSSSLGNCIMAEVDFALAKYPLDGVGRISHP